MEKRQIPVHEHIAGSSHLHIHSHEHTEAVVHRLSRAIGHLESVKKMVEDGRSCTDVLIQLAAVSGSLKSVSRVILRDHMEHCIVDAIERGDHTELEDLNRAIDQLMK